MILEPNVTNNKVMMLSVCEI